jgi:hypothetical protein
MKYKALFWQNYQAKSKEFDTLKEAFDFLVHGELYEELEAVGIFDSKKTHEFKRFIWDDGEPYLDDEEPKHRKRDLTPFGIAN